MMPNARGYAASVEDDGLALGAATGLSPGKHLTSSLEGLDAGSF